MRILLSEHAKLQCEERGATEAEVFSAVRFGTRERAHGNRVLCRMNFEFGQVWHGKLYGIKQVAPLIVEEEDETVVVTVFVFYF